MSIFALSVGYLILFLDNLISWNRTRFCQKFYPCRTNKEKWEVVRSALEPPPAIAPLIQLPAVINSFLTFPFPLFNWNYSIMVFNNEVYLPSHFLWVSQEWWSAIWNYSLGWYQRRAGLPMTPLGEQGQMIGARVIEPIPISISSSLQLPPPSPF